MEEQKKKTGYKQPVVLILIAVVLVAALVVFIYNQETEELRGLNITSEKENETIIEDTYNVEENITENVNNTIELNETIINSEEHKNISVVTEDNLTTD